MPPYSLPKTGPLVTLETAHFCTEEPVSEKSLGYPLLLVPNSCAPKSHTEL